MSKRLKGRSLYLTLLNESIASRIIRELELTPANILFCGGGRFTLIVPNTDKSNTILKQVQNKINEYFIKKFNAELYLSIVTKSCSGNDLRNFGQITKELSDKINMDKKTKFLDNPKALNDLFKIESDNEIKNKDTCSVCGKLVPISSLNDNGVCKSCLGHERLGLDASNAEYMIKAYVGEDFKVNHKVSFYNEALKLAYSFKSDELSVCKFLDEFKDSVEEFEVIRLNNTNFLDIKSKISDDVLYKVSFSFTFLGNTVPIINGNPLYFEHLAKFSTGANKFGVLKMDVDNLGLIFSKGFIEDGENKATISRVSTLSSQLDIFFSGFINNIANEFSIYYDLEDSGLAKDKINKFESTVVSFENEDSFKIYKKPENLELSTDEEKILENYKTSSIYIDYSGGDDVLVFGPYDDIILFAKKFRDDFKKWTCNNDSINISAGINIISPKFPIGKAVDMSEEFLEASKKCGKDKITLFKETLDWETKDSFVRGFEEVYDFATKLEHYHNDNIVSKSFIYSLLHMWQHSFKGTFKLVENKEDWEKNNLIKKRTKAYVPLFKYKLRLIKDRSVREDLNANVIKFMPWIRIPVSWASLRTRSR